jgi:tRNA threonylcarbamoyladenosine biosynthesis protein TsaE
VTHRLHTSSVDATRAVGAAVSALARPGDLLLLAGELGAGKTAFVQGFGAGLDVTELITSPTFVLARDYSDGRMPLHHLDVYRLEQMNEVYDIGLPEVLDDGGVTLIEWGDAIVPSLPPDFLEVRLTFGAEDDDRTIVVRAVGPSWSGRSHALGRALAAWALPVSGATGC